MEGEGISGIATTYVSIIWPALLTLINPTWPEALYPAEPWRFVDTTVGFMHESWHLRITDDGAMEYRHDQIPEAPAK